MRAKEVLPIVLHLLLAGIYLGRKVATTPDSFGIRGVYSRQLGPSRSTSRGVKMKFLLCLTAVCITFSFCSGACFQKENAAYMVDGKTVRPTECEDVFDGTKHPIGSIWDTGHCIRCSCGTGGLHCCTRPGGVVSSPGCKAILDREACEYKLYRLDDPTKPCFSQPS